MTKNKDENDSVFKNINAFEKDIGITKGFLAKLLKDDDWSFIIKLYSLFEAALTHLLVKELGRDELENVVSLLELAHSKKGKLAFARQLRLISPEEATYIKKLSELRDKIVHNVVNINFDIGAHVEKLDPQQFKSFANAFGFSIKKEIKANDKKINRNHYIKKQPKMAIWIGAFSCLETIYEGKRSAELSRTNPWLSAYIEREI